MIHTRREFLKLISSGYVVITASALPFAGCRPTAVGKPKRFIFPQGVASADPQPDSIVLWTHVEDAEGKLDYISLTLQVCMDESFQSVVVEQNVEAQSDRDNTVRVVLNGLDPRTTYYYRFIVSDGSSSPIGRTWTAPRHEDEAELSVAVASCQHYMRGYFSAYRRLINDDATALDNRKVDLIIHTGDFFYETPSWGTDLNGEEVSLTNPDGTERTILPFPDGEERSNNRTRAKTLNDFRHLYKTYISDPDLMEARRLFPFVYVWDDHELMNDYWQSHLTNTVYQNRKVDSNQAWFEYMPSALNTAWEGPLGENHAKDFEHPGQLEDVQEAVFDDDYLNLEPNNLKAIHSISIYRSLRWGKLADLFAIDGRSYRGDRGVPNEILSAGVVPYPSDPIDPAFVETMNAGRTANNGNPPDTVIYEGKEVENVRKNSPVGSVLGRKQKSWLKGSLQESTAVWKTIINNTPFMRFGFDVSFREGGTSGGIFWSDSWDGYPVERRELMTYLKDQKIPNVVSLTGDRHAHFAGYIYDNYDGDNPQAVIPEFACAGISATCRSLVQDSITRDSEDLADLVLGDGDAIGYTYKLSPTLNAWFIHGALAARAMAKGDTKEAEQQKRDDINPHMHYADNDAYGFLLAHYTAEKLEVEFVTIPEPVRKYGDDGPEAIRKVIYSVDRWESGKKPELKLVNVEGKEPVMGIRT
jgi:alkaline phosphatase D